MCTIVFCVLWKITTQYSRCTALSQQYLSFHIPMTSNCYFCLSNLIFASTIIIIIVFKLICIRHYLVHTYHKNETHKFDSGALAITDCGDNDICSGGSGNIFYNNFECTGEENRLEDCPRSSATHPYHDEDAGIFCSETSKLF